MWDETKLAADLEQKYCSTQDISTTAAHHLSLVQTTILSQAHAWMTPPPQFTLPVSHPPSFYSAPPHSSYPPHWSTFYYYLPPTIHPAYPHTYPISPPFLHFVSLLPPSRAAATAVPPTVYSQVTPCPTLVSSSYLPTPMTVSSPYPVLPPLSPSLISDSTSTDTPSPPQLPTVTPPPEHTGM